MPPGAHAINASRAGEPVSLAVNVNAEGAENAQKSFDAIMEMVQAGEEDRPYIDLNHEDREASGWPKGFVWAGDDPIKGGIRMKVEWSAAGKAAILGKTFRRFSPSFYVDQNGIVIGAPVNMGGLVNRAAFKRIAPVWSKSASAVEDPANKPQHEEQEPTMKSLLTVLARQGLLQSADVDEATAVSQVSAALAERATQVTAKETELTQAKTKLTDTEAKLDAALTLGATSTVEAAISAGRIPGQNDEVKAKWIALIKADPANAKLLPEPNEALKKVVSASSSKAADTKINAGAADQHPFMAKVAEYQATHKSSEAFAIEAVARTKEGAELYASYRESLYATK